MQRRALDLHQVVDRHRFRIGIEVGELRDQPGALRARLAHADDAAAADVHAGVAHALERVEAVLVVARGDDLAVELGRGVEVVVVVVEARVAQRSAWPSFSMPSVAQVSSPSALTARTISSTGSRSRSFGPRHAAPMQKRVAPAAFAARAAATTSSTSSIASLSTPV